MLDSTEKIGFNIYKLSSFRAFLLTIGYFITTKIAFIFIFCFIFIFIFSNFGVYFITKYVDFPQSAVFTEYLVYLLFLLPLALIYRGNREGFRKHANRYYSMKLSDREKAETGFIEM